MAERKMSSPEMGEKHGTAHTVMMKTASMRRVGARGLYACPGRNAAVGKMPRGARCTEGSMAGAALGGKQAEAAPSSHWQMGGPNRTIECSGMGNGRRMWE